MTPEMTLVICLTVGLIAGLFFARIVGPIGIRCAERIAHLLGPHVYFLAELLRTENAHPWRSVLLGVGHYYWNRKLYIRLRGAVRVRSEKIFRSHLRPQMEAAMLELVVTHARVWREWTEDKPNAARELELRWLVSHLTGERRW